jgi:hypothetical protein
MTLDASYAAMGFYRTEADFELSLLMLIYFLVTLMLLVGFVVCG